MGYEYTTTTPPKIGKTYPASHGVFAFIPRKVLVRLLIVLPELLHNILADVAVLFLDLPRNFELILGRNVGHLSTLTHEVEHELRNVAASNWNVLDRAADNVALRAGDDVRHTITRVDDRSRQCAVRNAVRRP